MSMDSTGMQALADVVHRSREEGTLVLIAGLHAQPMTVFQKSSSV